MPRYATATIAETGETLADKVLIADNPWLRFKGLMGKPALADGEGLLLSPCSSIHSCFMKFEFDALFLDKDNRIIHIERAMKPWRFSKVIWKAKKVLELPAKASTCTNVDNQEIIFSSVR